MVSGSAIAGRRRCSRCDRGSGSGNASLALSDVGDAAGVGLASVTASGAAGGVQPAVSRSAIRSATSCSVSRQPVPLPMAIIEIWCLRMSCSSFRLASVGVPLLAMRVDHRVFEQLPVSSSTASLHPVRMPGSIGQHLLAAQAAAGAAGSGGSSRRHDRVVLRAFGQFAADFAFQARPDEPVERVRRRPRSADPCAGGRRDSGGTARSRWPMPRSVSMRTRRTLAFSPRLMASTRCGGMSLTGSLKSKYGSNSLPFPSGSVSMRLATISRCPR